MNTLNKIIVGCGFISIALACSEDSPTYATEECNLNFVYYNNSGNPYTTDEITDEMCETNFSFMYSGEEATRDTIWFDIATMGNLSNEDRPIALQQFQVNGADNAEAGTHYVAFDDPEIAQFYQIPANANRASIPVILLRNDPTLEERTVVLKFGFKENDYFKSGYDTLSMHTIYITDRLAQPSNWDELGYFGSYGEQKHLLMIEWTGNTWDEDYIEELVEGDYAYITYLAQWMKNKLDEENAKRLADPNIGDIYREKDGTPVEFPGY